MILLPIEPLEERYSRQWLDQFIKDFNPRIVGSTKPQTIEIGEFLDVCGTNQYKMNQVNELIEILKKGDFEDGEEIVFMDGWYPGIEAIAYVIDCLDLNVKLTAILHAGTWDVHDYLASKLRPWAEGFQATFFSIYDRIIVATNFHKNMIIEAYPYMNLEEKIEVKTFPIFLDDSIPKKQKENIVVFPHRLAPEKRPELFDELEKIYQESYGDDWDVIFIKTKDVCKSKKEYYELLGKSKISVSFALQETFGIAMLESANLGCHCLVPDSLSYKETFPELYRWNVEDLNGLAAYIHDLIAGNALYPAHKHETTNFKHFF